MATKINNEFFSKNMIEAIKYDADKKGLTENFSFDFSVTKEDLPFDFDKDKFIEFFKQAFVVPRYCFDDFDYKIRFSGYISRIRAKNEYSFSFQPSEETITALKNLQNAMVESQPFKIKH